MKYWHFITLLLLFGCNRHDPFAFLEGPWDLHTSDNIELYVRPIDFTNSESPDSLQIDLILKNQNAFLDTINNWLNIESDSKFKIFLYNEDEALELIGTNTGGFVNGKRKSMYYTFLSKPVYHPRLDVFTYIGIHELVHLAASDVFGLPNNRMVNEGYAVAISDSYGAHIDQNGIIKRTQNRIWMERYVSEKKLLTPNELLYGNELPEKLYYPQAGTFINWLFSKFGVDRINKIYYTDYTNFERAFQEEFGIEFNSLETEYLKYCAEEFSVNKP